jgi:hypothetical protein
LFSSTSHKNTCGRAGGVAELGQCLPSKRKTLSSNPCTAKKKKNTCDIAPTLLSTSPLPPFKEGGDPISHLFLPHGVQSRAADTGYSGTVNHGHLSPRYTPPLGIQMCLASSDPGLLPSFPKAFRTIPLGSLHAWPHFLLRGPCRVPRCRYKTNSLI